MRKVDAIDRLLQIGFAEGMVTTHGLYEQVVRSRKTRHNTGRGAAKELGHRLHEALTERNTVSLRPATVGDCLRGHRARQGLDDREVSVRLDVPAAVYRMMETDTISPLNIHPRVWQKLMSVVGLSSEELETLIRTTCSFRRVAPSLNATLARYGSERDRSRKAPVMEDAAKELFLRSAAVLPQDVEQKVNALMERIAHGSS